MEQEQEDLREMGNQIREFFRGSEGKFRPFVYFNSALDRLELVLRDCSICEIRDGGSFTVFEDNYPDGRQKYVGIALECAGRLTQLSPAQMEALAVFLDGIVAKCTVEDLETLMGELAKALV